MGGLTHDGLQLGLLNHPDRRLVRSKVEPKHVLVLVLQSSVDRVAVSVSARYGHGPKTGIVVVHVPPPRCLAGERTTPCLAALLPEHLRRDIGPARGTRRASAPSGR